MRTADDSPLVQPVRMARAPGQHPDVYPGSPSGLIGVFVALLRTRFTSEFSQGPLALPWYWSPDATPTNDDGGPLPCDPPGTSPPGRRIAIEKQSQEYPDAKDTRPGLFVGRSVMNYTSQGVTNKIEQTYPTMADVMSAIVGFPLSVNCCSREEGENDTLADTVASFLFASQDEICELFHLTHAQPPQIGEPEIVRRAPGNVEFHRTTVSMYFETKITWRRWPIAPRLNDIRLRITASTG